MSKIGLDPLLRPIKQLPDGSGLIAPCNPHAC